MSLKSFDKFCEDLILKEPESNKIILDERQKIQRSRILTEALLIFTGLVFVNSLVMDMIYQWAENHFGPLLVFMMLCAVYFNIRSAAAGCLVGINGERSAKFSAGYCVFMGILMLIKVLFEDEESKALFADGKATDRFCALLVFVLTVGCGVLTLILLKASRKEKEEDEQ